MYIALALVIITLIITFKPLSITVNHTHMALQPHSTPTEAPVDLDQFKKDNNLESLPTMEDLISAVNNVLNDLEVETDVN
jgi:hypothetical protein